MLIHLKNRQTCSPPFFLSYLGPLCFMVLALLIFSPAAYASASSPLIYLASNSISLAKAASKIKKKTNGRILSTKKSGSGNKTIYMIKVLMPNGQVKTFQINASTGAIQ